MNGAMDLAGAILLALGAFFCMSAAIGASTIMNRLPTIPLPPSSSSLLRPMPKIAAHCAICAI